MGDLTLNFSRREFACPCCGQAKIRLALVDALQELRHISGSRILVLSGYRCGHHNREVGGVDHSRHLTGQAADIVIAEMTVLEMASIAPRVKKFREGGMGIYPSRGFIHVDVRGWRARWGAEWVLRSRCAAVVEAWVM